MQAFYSDQFVLPLPAGHRFPMSKYASLRKSVQELLPQVRLREAPQASDGQLALAHHPNYITRLSEGQLSSAEQRSIGFPWSVAMVERARRSVGATIAAARVAAHEGVAFNLAGGTHHAGHAQGGGFCCFNDVAVAARLMQAERVCARPLIVDLDVHQGNGTAQIMGADPSVFTLSLHGEKNYPFRKELSHLDLALPDGCDDATYAQALSDALDQVQARFKADFAFFIAGADVYKHDRLGRLGLTLDGIAQRDRQVFDFVKGLALPVVVVMGGGYCAKIEETVAIHYQTVTLGLKHWLECQDKK